MTQVNNTTLKDMMRSIGPRKAPQKAPIFDKKQLWYDNKYIRISV